MATVTSDSEIGAITVTMDDEDKGIFSEVFCQHIFGVMCCDGGEDTRKSCFSGFEIAFDHPVVGDTVSIFCRMFIQVTKKSAIFFFDHKNWGFIADVLSHMKKAKENKNALEFGSEILESWCEETTSYVYGNCMKEPDQWFKAIEKDFSGKK